MLNFGCLGLTDLQDHVLKTHAQGKGYDRRIVDVRCEEKEVSGLPTVVRALELKTQREGV